mgnify:CR=1 FL=1
MHIPLEAYFPDCVLPHCPQQSTPHQHILSHQQNIIDCTSKYLYCQGGVGSAKSLAFAVKTVKLSLEIPENIGIVARRDFKLLYRSSWSEVKACIKRLVQREYLDLDWFNKHCYSKKDQGDYSIITFPNDSILYATQTKNFSESLGTGYGIAWVDDAMETPEEFFIGDNTSAGLLSRIRLPHVHYNKSTYDEIKRPHGSLHCMVSSNPPPYGHWLHRLFGNKPGTYKIGDDVVTWMQTLTTDNPFVGADYAKGLIAVQHKMGNNENTTRRVIFGESIPAYKGIPVFPQFSHAKHVAPLKFKPDLPLIRSWDFGHQHPAVVFSNLYRCKYRNNHYFTLSEVADAYNVTIYRFYDQFVKPHTDALYKTASLIRDAGDRAGFRESSSNKDGRSDMKILINEYKLPFRWRFLNLKPSLQYMRGLLEPKEPCKCGIPFILISNKCPMLIGALEGGYHYPKGRNGIAGDKPIEDKHFADIACAWRYGAENYVKHWGFFNDETDIPLSYRSPRTVEQSNIDWLNEADKEIIQRIYA